MSVNLPEVLSAHPVAPEIRQRVMDALAGIETEHGVRILFACESGSRGWGFASPDSDYDVRFIYVHRLPWYLAVESGRDVIELPISDELDISGWELRKALRLLRRANPVLLEWLDSPIVYRNEADWLTGLRTLVPRYFSPLRSRHHYLSMAKKNFRGYLQDDVVRLKKYFYVLRPLLAVRWIDEGYGLPPMRFADLVTRLVTEPALRTEINELLAIKMRSGEAELGARRPAIQDFITNELAAAERNMNYKLPEGDAKALDAFLMETILMHSSDSENKGRHGNC